MGDFLNIETLISILFILRPERIRHPDEHMNCWTLTQILLLHPQDVKLN